ncbi:MAG: phage tail assembly chaperone [Hyphomonadaceae bacterium]
MSEATPWPELLRIARQIGVAPAAFWSLSLREWRAIADTTMHALSAADFAALAQRFPDTPHD